MINFLNRCKQLLRASPFFTKQEATEITLIKNCLQEESVKRFITDYETLLHTYSSEQNFNYIGVNFHQEEILSIKFYAHIFANITEEELLNFVPSASDYSKYIPYRSEAEKLGFDNAGIALELKYNIQSKTVTTGFFFHLDKEKSKNLLLDQHKKLPVELSDGYIARGVNFEYTGNKVKFKTYYYFKKDEFESFFKTAFKINFAEKVNHFEYAISENDSKLNTYYNNVLMDDIGMKAFSKKELKVIESICKQFNLKIMGFGQYKNLATRSVYFVDANQSKIKENSNHLQTISKLIAH